MIDVGRDARRRLARRLDRLGPLQGAQCENKERHEALPSAGRPRHANVALDTRRGLPDRYAFRSANVPFLSLPPRLPHLRHSGEWIPRDGELVGKLAVSKIGTVGEFLESGTGLSVHCLGCRRHVKVDLSPVAEKHGRGYPIVGPDTHFRRSLKCSACGARKIQLTIVAPGVATAGPLPG